MVNDMHISKSHGYLLNMFLNTFFISLMAIIEDIEIQSSPNLCIHIIAVMLLKMKRQKPKAKKNRTI